MDKLKHNVGIDLKLNPHLKKWKKVPTPRSKPYFSVGKE